MKARVRVRRDTYDTPVALHAMYDTVHRALINRYTHTRYCMYRYNTYHIHRQKTKTKQKLSAEIDDLLVGWGPPPCFLEQTARPPSSYIETSIYMHKHTIALTILLAISHEQSQQ